MRNKISGASWALALAALVGIAGQVSAEVPPRLPLQPVADIPLPGRSSRFDYQAYDPARGLLFIAHLGDSAVTVIDTRNAAVVANIPGIRQVHGLLAIPELGRVYASATGARQVVAIDAQNFDIVATIPGGRYPDGLAYSPSARKLYVADKAGDVIVIDPRSNEKIGTITLGSEVGNLQFDPVSRHIFVNLQGRNELAEIDSGTDTVVARYPLPGAEGNHGLLIEPTSRLAFITCEGNARLLVFDLERKEVITTLAVGSAPDTLAYDPGLDLLYVASESGVVSMFRVAHREVTKLWEGQVAPRAHSIAVVPTTHRVYLPLENVGNRPLLRVMSPAEGDR